MMKRIKSDLRPDSELGITLRMLKKNKTAIVGIIIIVVLVFVALLHPFIAPHDPLEINLEGRFLTSNKEFPLGTDEFGRCILSRIIYGSTISLKVSVISVSIAFVIGILIGAISGYYSGKVDMAIMRVVDILISFPTLVLALGIMAVLGRGIEKLIFALSFIGWTSYARVVRSQALSLRKMEFVEAAKVFGASNLSIILSHIVPNTLSSCIVLATFQLGSAILTEASLSFLGLGVPPPTPSWGNMLSHSREYLFKAPHLAIFPGLAITIVILAFNLMGDGLRDALDPRLRI